MEVKKIEGIANLLRRDSLEMTSAAGSGHPSSCLSCAEIMSVLFFEEMKYDVLNSENPDNDEFILSKGHAAPILYASLSKAGVLKSNLRGLRKISSPFEGHPMPGSLKWVKVATGSLGQGLSVGVGMAIAAKKQRRDFRTYVLLGDSEMSEGSNYEAMQIASFYKLNNLCAIVDVNRLGQRGETIPGHNLKEYEKRFSAFGWDFESVDGHNVSELKRAFERARKSKKPFAIIAKTIKGKGVSFLENKEGWHGKALNPEELRKAIDEIPEQKIGAVKIRKPIRKSWNFSKAKYAGKRYSIGGEISTREAYGDSLMELAKSDSRVVAIDAEVSNSTFSDKVKKARTEQFVEAFIAEQNLVGMSLGMSKKGFRVFSSTFSAFLSRAHDQIRMAALSKGDFTLCGSHCGVSIGEDGASQMGLEDIAMFRSLPDSIIFYPSDAVSTKKVVEQCDKLRGLKYIRTTRGKTPVIYSNDEKFDVGQFKVLRESNKDRVVLVGAGITLHECLKAHEKLKEKKISSAVIDLYCVKPFNSERFLDFVKKHGGKIVVVEDHYVQGGIGEMICSVLKDFRIEIEHLAVREIPHSGKPEELLNKYGIDSEAIEKAAKKII